MGILVGVVLVAACTVLGLVLLFNGVASRSHLDQLLANGLEVKGRLLTVDAGVLSSVSGHMRVYSVGIELEFEGERGVLRVRSKVVVPETLRHLLQAGAPCVAMIDPKDPTTLCLVEIKNPYGAPTAVTLGSMYSRW